MEGLDRKASGLPDGLPASLAKGDAGYRALCSLVGLETRSAKQAFAGSREVKSALKGHEPKSRRRLQSTILAFYRSVQARSETWREAAGVGTSTDLRCPPSLEFRILSAYDSGLLVAPIDEDALLACADLFEPEKAKESWHRLALAALPLIRRDVLAWERQSEDRQGLLALAAFAAASMLDDARLIEWAAGQAPELASEYGIFLTSALRPDGESPTDAETAHVPQSGLRASCEELAATVRQLLDSPVRTEIMFDELARAAGVVEGFRRPVLDRQDEAERTRLIDAVCEHIESQPDVIGRLGRMAPLRDHWRAAYLSPSKPATNFLRDDLSRLTAELPRRLAKWKDADAKIDAILQRLSSASGRRDRRIAAALVEQGEIADKLWQDVEELLSPTGHPFDFPKEMDGAAPHTSDEAPVIEDRGSEEGQDSSILPTVAATPSFEHHREQGNDGTDVDAGDDSAAARTTRTSSKAEISSGADRPTSEPSKVSAVVSSESETGEVLPPDLVVTAFWKALARKEIGVAYYIVRLARTVEGKIMPPQALVATLALAEHIHSPEGELVNSYAAQLAEVGASLAPRAAEDSLNLLMVAATLRPSLFAPSTGAFSLLGQVELSQPFRPIADAALRMSQSCARLQGMDIHRLEVSLEGGDFDERMDALADAVKGSAKDAEVHRESYVPAQRVWQFWLTSGLIFRLVENVSDANVASVQQIVDLYRDEKRFADHVSQIGTRSSKGRRKDIDNRTVRSLRRSLDPILRHATAWLRLAKDRGTSAEGSERAVIADLKRGLDDLRLCISRAKEAEVQNAGEHSPVWIALNRAADAADDLSGTFDQTTGDHWRADVPAQAILARELLLVPGISIDLDYRILDESDALVALQDQNRYTTLNDAFRQRLQRRDIAGASLVCDWMAAKGDRDEEVLREELDVAIGSFRDETERKMRRLVGEIEDAHAKMHIGTSERDELAGRMSVPLENSVRGIGDLMATCLEVESKLAVARERSVEGVRQEVKDLIQPASETARSAIEAALKAGNVAGAREIVYKLDTGESIPKRIGSRDHLVDFLDAASDIEIGFGGRERPSLNDVDEAGRSGTCVGGLSFGKASEIAPPSDLLDPWYRLARKRSLDANLVKRIFESLGFVGVDVEVDGSVEVGGSNATVLVSPLGDRLQCPLHQYGSTALGKYPSFIQLEITCERPNYPTGSKRIDFRHRISLWTYSCRA